METRERTNTMTTLIITGIENFTSESVRGIAYAIAQGGPELRDRGLRRQAFRNLRDLIALLDSRATGGDTSELKEMAFYWSKGLEADKATPRQVSGK
jgi:hypothetical protein